MINASAFRNETPLPNRASEERAEDLFKNIRCMVCQGESLAESNADLASDMRKLIRTKIADGESDEQIEAYLTSRYGQQILQDPPLDNRTYLLWFAPLIIFIGGSYYVLKFTRRKNIFQIMKIKIIAVGKNKDKNLLALQDEYLKRCKNWKIQLIEIEQNPKTEVQNILHKLDNNDFIIALDEHGQEFKSTDFSAKLEQIAAKAQTITFLIGPADGHSPEILARANLKLAFGKLTWAHMLIRVMLAEQLYRAWSIAHGAPLSSRIEFLYLI